MDIKSLKKEISTKMYLYSRSNSLYRHTYNEFNKTIDPYTIRDDNFLLTKSQFADVAKNWNIKTNNETINNLYDTIEPNVDKISYNQLINKLIN